MSRANMVDLIEALRAQPGDSVTIHADLSEPDLPGQVVTIDVRGEWTGWTHCRFDVRTVVEALERAAALRRERRQ